MLKAKGATPLEDCGGIMGHEHIKAVFADHSRPEYEEYCEHLDLELGMDWDFDDPDMECGEIGEVKC